MAINRTLWQKSFYQLSFPRLPCPHCSVGRLKLVPDSFILEEPEFSRSLHSHDAWEPDWDVGRFSARLKCDERICGEIVNLSGDTDIHLFVGEDGWEANTLVRPQAAFPPPPLFRVPKDAPEEVKKQVQLASLLYWADLPSSVGRLRAAVEATLDEKGIERTKIAKTGKVVRMDLAERIKVFAETPANAETKDALDSLRIIGNLGTHGEEVAPEAFFDAVDVLDHVLELVYGTAPIKAKIQKLIETKGDYRKKIVKI